MSSSPYENLPARAFWKTGVSAQTPEEVEDLWRPKFEIGPEVKVATAGSCFAQHIARFLRQRGCSVVDAEPPPPGLGHEAARKFGYELYSARYGNIYTVRQLLQLGKEAYGGIPLDDCVWERGGRFYDAYRPSVEPSGLGSPAAVVEHRERHLERVRSVFDGADVLIFTFGLTEAWIHRDSGRVYPTAPGTVAGLYDPEVYEFKNFSFSETYSDFVEFRSLLRKRNPGVKILVTVSPVPLTATATDNHVLVATTYSKSVLRAVAGELASEFEDIDYFPSYEIIAAPFSHGKFYETNLRSVREEGVRTVMRVFFNEPALPVALERPAVVINKGARKLVEAPEGRNARLARRALRVARRAGRHADVGTEQSKGEPEEVVCEEILLDAFAR